MAVTRSDERDLLLPGLVAIAAGYQGLAQYGFDEMRYMGPGQQFTPSVPAPEPEPEPEPLSMFGPRQLDLDDAAEVTAPKIVGREIDL